jgi:ATP-dependent Clp protease ATP-binding subunit ClpB
MSFRIDAATSLLTVAEKHLQNTRAGFDEFLDFVQTADDATRNGQGPAKMMQVYKDTQQAAIGVQGAHVALKDTEGAAGARTALEEAYKGVSELNTTMKGLVDQISAGKGGSVDAGQIRGQISKTAGAVDASHTTVGNVPQGERDEEAKWDDLAKEIKNDKSLKDLGVSGPTIDETIDEAKATRGSGLKSLVEAGGVNMVEEAKKGKYDALVGREDTISQLETILSRKKKPNPVLIGDPGVGKTQIVEGLALNIANGRTTPAMRDMQIWTITASDLMAAAGPNQGALEGLVKKIVDEVKGANEAGQNVVLFIDEMHTLMAAGGAAQQLKPALARGEIKALGATTEEEYRKLMSNDGALDRRLAKVTVEGMTVPQTLDVLRSGQKGLEDHHKIRVLDSALGAAADYTHRYIRGRALPDPAIELVDHAMAKMATDWRSGSHEKVDTLENELGRLQAQAAALKTEAEEYGDVRAGEQLKKVEARMDEVKPELESLKTQLHEEREVLGARQALLRDFEAARDSGDKGKAEKTLEKLGQANTKVRELREKYPERLLTDVVDEQAIKDAMLDLHKIPVASAGQSDAEKLRVLPDTIKKMVIGQDAAVDSVANAVRVAKSGMKDDKGPIGVFVFRGPTGVGKTELARALAKHLFDDEKALHRYDMGEFSEPHSISKLLGSPPGYVGFDGGGRLVNDLNSRPESIVLFDEVEKAHPSIFQKLLAFTEEGRITSGDGKTADGRHAIIIMTTNLKDEATMQSPAFNDFFKPEFRNRIDEVIAFESLDKEDLGKILNIKIGPLEKQASANGLELSVDDAARSYLLEHGNDPEMGARPLERSVQTNARKPISDLLIDMRSRGIQVDGDHVHKATLSVNETGDGLVANLDDPSILEKYPLPTETTEIPT